MKSTDEKSSPLTAAVNLEGVPEAIVFDVDGTLYSTLKLRFYMIFEMISMMIYSPQRILDLKIVWDFRNTRQTICSLNNQYLAEEQYNRAAKVSRVSPQKVYQVVKEWIYEKPLPYLALCRYAEVKELFSMLKRRGIRIGIFSDYPAKAKLKALELDADVVVEATDREVNHLKPHPTGLLVTAKRLKLSPGSCLFIGDQDDKDGECARRANMPYIILSPKNRDRQFQLLRYYVKKWTV